MVIRTFLVSFLCLSAASATGCCRGFKILQFRRPNLMPIYEPPATCDSVFDDQEQFCENPLYSTEPLAKYETPVNRYYPPYVEPKPMQHKCMCNKPMAPQRMMPNVPRYYKRNYCNDPMIEELALRAAAAPCEQYPCPQYGDCSQYGQCGQCGQCPQCAPCAQCNQCGPCGQFNPCGMPPVFRQPPHRMLPLTLPPSCVC